MKNIFSSSILFLMIPLLACGSAPEAKKDFGDAKMGLVKVQNDSLAKIPVEGFDYRSSKVPAQKWDKWAAAAAPVVKGIINNLPDGYVLQVTGHADGRGPEDAAGGKPGNIKISTQRAKAVYDALKGKGITSPKMTYKGVGSADPVSGLDPNDPKQRRVTFKVVPK